MGYFTFILKLVVVPRAIFTRFCPILQCFDGPCTVSAGLSNLLLRISLRLLLILWGCRKSVSVASKVLESMKFKALVVLASGVLAG